MKKMLLPFSLLVLIFSSCTNADPKKMASDLCDCIQTKKKLSSQAKKVILNAAKSGDEFQTAVQTEVQKIDDQEKMQAVNDELTTFFEAIQSKKTIACAEEIDKKYRVTKTDEKEMQKKLLAEMQEVEGCEAYTAIVKLGFAKQDGTETTKEDEETTEDTEKPTKRKTTEEEEQ